MILEDIENFVPFNKEEETDKKVLIRFIRDNPDYLLRTNPIGHFSSSAWIVNEDFSKVLMCYHRIYDSWSWCGGHADGDGNLLEVAVREVKEETGLSDIKVLSDKIFSIECLHVMGHYKNGRYVSSHLHFNLTYLVQADEKEKLVIKPDENKDLAWFTLNQVLTKPSETWMVEHIYKKELEKTRLFLEKSEML